MKIAVDMLPVQEDGSNGGATAVAIELIKGFAAAPGVRVLVLCADRNIKFLKKMLPGNIQFWRVEKNRFFTEIGRITGILKRITGKGNTDGILKKNRADILFCPFSAPTFKEKGIPTVSTIHDIQHEFYPQFFELKELEHRRRFYRDIVKNVEQVACISDYTRETFCEKYSYPPDRAQTIYNAVQNRFDKEDTSVLTRFDLHDRAYILYPANFWEHKNHKLLLNAFATYALGHKNLKLVLTGNVLSQDDYYENLLKALKIEERTVITGFLTNEEMCCIFKNAKGVIFPSLFEGFGIPIVEAMRFNKLIACSNLTCLPEIGCKSVFYFDPRKPDDILRGIYFLADNEVTEAVKADYAEKLKNYRTDKMIGEYLRLFEKVIADNDIREFV